MLSKSTGQIIRLSAVMNILFHLDDLDDRQIDVEGGKMVIAPNAIKAAIHFIEVSCQHVAFIAGRGEISQEIDTIKQGMYHFNRCTK